ncbi:MerR family transcriptional regulator [Sinosporangium siamense]|uniref:MerR family transcriptional regulator n=1 Tax=Sinosporangium siamense TaxID=1367973 RepID=A0A919RAW4_9ACTN|nr:MerR family transcriptional regulator [Sinosporangium siamense]GII90565.1 MerR family transcriptional regulator [Sinosporangium siamense]
MRIGELAQMVGVSTRTVRHYHQQGVMPEPERTAGGYRDYNVKDAVLLARVRRLTELGLSLAEVRDVLADNGGKELREVLLELDGDLARQAAAIERRRERLAALLAKEEIHPDDAVSPELAEIFASVKVPESAMFKTDRELLALMDTTADPQVKQHMFALVGPLRDPKTMERGIDINRRIEALADAAEDDPRVDTLAEELAAFVPPELAEAIREGLTGDTRPFDGDFLEEMGLAPAQAAVVRKAVLRITAGGDA